VSTVCTVDLELEPLPRGQGERARESPVSPAEKEIMHGN